MKRTVVLVSVLFFLATFLRAQEGAEPPKGGFQREKLFIGGNFGLTFGDYTLINVSPQLGYRFTDLFAAGLGLNAQYVGYKQRDANGNPYHKTSQTVFGINMFGRAYPIRNIILQAQPEVNYLFGKQIWYGPPKQEYKLDATLVPSLLLGGGAVFPSGRSELIISVLYDVLQDKDSPYGNRPVYNFGYNIRF